MKVKISMTVDVEINEWRKVQQEPDHTPEDVRDWLVSDARFLVQRHLDQTGVGRLVSLGQEVPT